MAFQECGWDEDAIPFYREPKEGRPVFVRISDKKKTEMLLTLAKEKGSEKGIRVHGELVAEEKLIDFDLSSALN